MSKYQVMPAPSAEERAAMKADIQVRGIVVPVIRDEDGNTLDGHTREEIARELGIECPAEVYTAAKTDAEKRAFARSINIARRHLNREQKRALIEEQLRETPELSDNQIAKDLGVDHKTVTAARNSNWEIPNKDSGDRREASGRKARGRKPSKVTPEVKQKIATEVLDEGKTLKASANKRQVSEQVAKIAVAHEEGKREARETERLIADDELSPTALKKNQAHLRQRAKAQDAEFMMRVSAEARTYFDKEWLAIYHEKLKQAELVIRGRRGVFTEKEYRNLYMCIHPDQSASKEVRDRSSEMWKERKIALVGEKEMPTEPLRHHGPLPSNEEMQAMAKARWDAKDAKAARAKKKSETSPRLR